ncbi:hypothetical protein [Clostridium tarantellae]|uniref:DUF5808 domain-containing protein n=1 Tax=Clostridium tarantellae TaxID=39493 RepID=A0A6I1MN42_9CLOT|nr:hypothetical protein [Clostridium tarantellae]MPQ44815.1 hypothetical protein [Clostridium tarantellae]
MIKDKKSKHNKLRIFYYNPKNHSGVVNKRKGIGSTINFGSKEGRHLFAAMMIPVFIAIIVIIVIVALKK